MSNVWKHRYLIWYLFFCFSLGTLLTAMFPVSAATITVKPSGGDFDDIQDAIDDASNGDTIVIYAGTYTPSTSLFIDGFDGLTVIANTGDTVIINGSNVPEFNSLNAAIEINNSDDVRISGLCVTWSGMGGIGVDTDYLAACDGIRIDNCTIYECAGYGIKSGTGVDNLEIDYCTLYNNFNNWSENDLSQELISLSSTDGFFIHHNTIYNNPCENIDLKAGTSNGVVSDNWINTSCDYWVQKGTPWYMGGIGIYVDARGTANNITIERNYVTGNITLCELNTETTGHYSNITVRNNIFYLVNPSGGAVMSSGHVPLILFKSGSSTDKTFADIDIVHNTFVKDSNLDKPLIQIGHYTSVYLHKGNLHRVSISNNILYSATTVYSFFQCTKINYTDGNVMLYSNLFYKPSGTYRINFYGDKTIGPAWGSGYIAEEDPLFVAAGSDFSLLVDSPCIDAGSSVYGVSVDYDGVVRPKSFGYDIGAFEYWSAPPPPPVIPPEDPNDPFIPNVAPSVDVPLAIIQVLEGVSPQLVLIGLGVFIVWFIWSRI